MPSASESIRDDLIGHDIDLRRVTAGVQREVDRRLLQLGRELKVLIADIDIPGTKRNDARKRRLAKMQTESRVLINTAYSEISTMVRKDLRQLARLESRKMGNVIRDNIP